MYKKAQSFLTNHHIDGEIVVCDNGSTDESVEIAKKNNARVVSAAVKGYGAALITGCQEAKGIYVIMGDADDSYDFLNLMPFVEKLREGYQLVIGNRFEGGIEKGAMPWSHRFLGVPLLSFLGRLLFHCKIKDFHCGLRGYEREAIISLNLETTGMEYASEMIVKAVKNGLKISEIPVKLRKDGRNQPSHLNSIRDGWRHMRFLVMYKIKTNCM